MNDVYSVAIVGGGASGLACAIELVNRGISGKDILILEKNDRVGKKLLATGNGQGNVSNALVSQANYHGDKDFISVFFSCNKKPNVEDLFKQLSLPLCVDSEGRKYPLSKQASSVLDIMREFLFKNGVNVITNAEVSAIKKSDEVFLLYADKEYKAQKVVTAFGGKAGKQFGTNGTAYDLLKPFGHTITKLYPSLVQLKTEKEKIKGLKGLKEKVKLSVKYGEETKEFQGDLLFTDYGISGDTVFKISPFVADKTDAKINVEFLPFNSAEEIEGMISERLKKGFTGESLLNGIINKKIGCNVLKLVKEVNARNVVKALKQFTLNVTGTLGYDYAQVTKGGIECFAVNPITFESKNQSGLYIIGEALNVDGDCGGYNLDFAFSSAMMSAKAIVSQ